MGHYETSGFIKRSQSKETLYGQRGDRTDVGHWIGSDKIPTLNPLWKHTKIQKILPFDSHVVNERISENLLMIKLGIWQKYKKSSC